MKMKEEHFEALKAAMEPIMARHPEAYDQYRKAGLSDKRYRWDVWRASKFDICPFYSYLNDTHIDTALKEITGKRN